MKKSGQTNAKKNYSQADINKIRQRAKEIWKRKRESLSTALDDWLQAERELKKQLGIEHKTPEQYSEAEIQKIKERAQAVREKKVASLRTEFNDWIEAEEELKDELNKTKLSKVFDLWFGQAYPHVKELLKTDSDASRGSLDDIFGEYYIELMAQCMK